MTLLTKKEYLKSMQSFKTKHDALTVKLYSILELLEQRSKPLDVNGLDTKTYLELKIEVILTIGLLHQADAGIARTFYQMANDLKKP
jgi:hypothetical protein